ncbi:MAG: hypothetical protein K8U03_15965 [Planctomycetia bacterium]|nr:hypothetical protein [Planctomycetia bacterium]
MKKLTQLMIPLGLGIAAFVMNWMAVQPQLGREFVVASGAIEIDQPLKEGNLSRFKIVGENFDRLKQTLVPWEERAALLGLPVQRRLQAGDVLFWQDVRYVAADFLTEPDEIPLHVSLEGVDYEPNLLKVGNQVGLIVPSMPAASADATPSAGATSTGPTQYEELGPFRILSIGLRTEAAPNEDAKSSAQRGNVRILTLAMKTDAPRPETTSPTSRSLPAAAQKLLYAQSLRRSDGKAIVAMVLYQDIAKLRRLREAAATTAAPTGTGPAGTTPIGTATKSIPEEPKKP